MPDEALSDPSGEAVGSEGDEGDSDGPLITLTPAAAERVRELIAGVSDVRLRVAIEKRGRPRHIVSLSDESEDGDIVFEHDGVAIAVAALNASLLRGATVDYVSGDGGGRFEVTNPNLVPFSIESLTRERAERKRGEAG
jgi:iron-sulfur cluster assembly accessory protein